MDSGLFITRLIFGLAISAHGAQKLFGWFGGYGIKGTGGFLEGLGYRPGVLFALAAGLGEAGGGLLTAAGFLAPVGPALVIMVMLVAIFSVHLPNGFFATSNGFELPLLYLTGALALVFAGAGSYSVDTALGIQILPGPGAAWAAVVAAVVLALANLAVRRRAPAIASASSLSH